MTNTVKFIRFESSIEGIELPKKFTYPFNYEPHPLCIKAASELQCNLSDNTTKGKMYGVLVVENCNKELGYLSAMSGSNSNNETYNNFVPPIFDLSGNADFYKKGESELIRIKGDIDSIENSEEYKAVLADIEDVKKKSSEEISLLKEQKQLAKKSRESRREEAIANSDIEKVNNELVKESQRQSSELAKVKKFWKTKELEVRKEAEVFSKQLDSLNQKRKIKSAQLQQQIFKQYSFLNAKAEAVNLFEIFKNTEHKVPPSAAGECAAPKLLQYAYSNNLKPIAMAEFWWGSSPKSEIRKHGYFYPACQLKCKPILSHMLKGLNVDEDPIIVALSKNKDIDIVFEDEYMIVVNKPSGLLAVPGKQIEDSVYIQVKQRFADLSGPVIAHRLDMATSGLMLIARTKDVHESLQKQFLYRAIRKRYVALLNGKIEGYKGVIELPIRVDLDDRPRQVVCYEYGKHAKTEWEVVEINEDVTRVNFYPITGRTHQLRVHAAHQSGLNTPIIGDELYGKKADRLYLHAESISFKHPVTNEDMYFTVKADF